MRLFYAETLNPRKACAVARHLQLPVEYVRVDLARQEQRQPGFLAMNPNAKVPVLQAQGRFIWEANAIMAHLAIVAGSPMWPREPQQQVELTRWLGWNSEHFSHYAGTLYFEHLVKPSLGWGDPDPQVVDEAIGYVRQYGAVLDDHLRGRQYLLGEQLTIADFAVAVTLPYAEAARIPLEAFPAVRRWHERLCELPAWLAPFPPESQSTDWCAAARAEAAASA